VAPSSIKFALFEAARPRSDEFWTAELSGWTAGGYIPCKGLWPEDNFFALNQSSDHKVAVGVLMDWIEQSSGRDALTAVGPSRGAMAGRSITKPQRIYRRIWLTS